MSHTRDVRARPGNGFLRAFEYRGIAAPDARYAARHSDDPVWPPPVRAYGGPTEPSNRQKAVKLALAAVRLAVPVSLLLVPLGAAFLYATICCRSGGRLARFGMRGSLPAT
jgi:hypothetical protein